MIDVDHFAGELASWPSKERLAALLRQAGLPVRLGRYSVRVEDCSHFVFQNYGGDLGEPSLDVDAASSEELLRDAQRVSEALARVGLVHRFELYDAQGTMVAYLHHGWPSASI